MWNPWRRSDFFVPHTSLDCKLVPVQLLHQANINAVFFCNRLRVTVPLSLSPWSVTVNKPRGKQWLREVLGATSHPEASSRRYFFSRSFLSIHARRNTGKKGLLVVYLNNVHLTCYKILNSTPYLPLAFLLIQFLRLPAKRPNTKEIWNKKKVI